MAMTQEEKIEIADMVRSRDRFGPVSEEELAALPGKETELWIRTKNGKTVHVFEERPENLPEQAALLLNFHGGGFLKGRTDRDRSAKVAEDLETIITAVDSVKNADFKISFDPTLVRGMSYYTGPIFEIAMDEFGGSVGGGGRYDEMIGKFTGQNTSACGFSIGFERIVMLLLERGYEIPTNAAKKAYLIEKNMPADKLLPILKQAEEERRNGVQVNISIMKKNKKFQKEQMTAEGYTEFVEFFNK